MIMFFDKLFINYVNQLIFTEAEDSKIALQINNKNNQKYKMKDVQYLS